MTRLRFVWDRRRARLYGEHPLTGKEGYKLAQGVGPGPKNVLVLVDGVGCVIAPYGNWRKVAQ